LDRCLKPVEIHVFQVRAAQFFAVSFVESVETNGVEDLPEWSAVTKNPDKRSFGSGAVYLERNGHETLPLGLSCSKILFRLSVRLVRVRSRVDEKAHAREPSRENLRHGSTAAHYSEGVVMAKVTLMKREPTHLQIAHRAFEIYISRGGHHGHDVGDWFEAERQLRTELQPKKRAVKQTRMKA
jgi:Protein of unknown function (DUF2934)